MLLDAISDLRRAIFALRPVDLDAMGFFPALAQLVAGFGDQHQLAARLEVTGPQDALPACYELPLLRVIQQGLNNIGQHAGASSVLLCVAVDPAGGVRVALRDDGRGFDTSQVGPITQTGHFGLRQMRERIVDRGGTLDIAIRAGARGYLLKTVDAGELIASIEAVCRGDYLIDPVVATRVLSELHLHVPRQAPRVDPLTEGEMAVLRLVAQGVDNRDIARALNYSVHTVANRLRIIYEKLHVTNRTQAALYALRQGWAALDDPPA